MCGICNKIESASYVPSAGCNTLARRDIVVGMDVGTSNVRVIVGEVVS